MKELKEVKNHLFSTTPNTDSNLQLASPARQNSLYSEVVRPATESSPPVNSQAMHLATSLQKENRISGLRPPTTDEKKFNIVIFGVDECASGSPRHACSSHDLEAAVRVLSSLDDSIQSTSIRDQFRLGKYAETRKRPRPLLIKFIRSADAYSVLAKKSSLSHPIFIRPDMTREERISHSILMKERWKLIESGVNRKDLKVRGKGIYVKDLLHGKLDSNNHYSWVGQVETVSEVTPMSSQSEYQSTVPFLSDSVNDNLQTTPPCTHIYASALQPSPEPNSSSVTDHSPEIGDTPT